MKKKLTKMYSILKSPHRPLCINVHIVIETEKRYEDFTYRALEQDKNLKELWDGNRTFIGSYYLKQSEYKLFANQYCIYMYGTDLKKLKNTWEENFAVAESDGLAFNSGIVNAYLKSNSIKEIKKVKEYW